MDALANRGWYLLGFSIISMLIVGCSGSSGPRVVPASGKISFKGEPLESGTITFSPVDAKETVATSAQIVDGQYQTEKGQGVSAGTYKVVVNVQRIPADLNETDKKNTKLGTTAAKELMIPEKYSNYKTTTLELEVSSSDSSVTKDFDLTD